jgi:hypothetical protein
LQRVCAASFGRFGGGGGEPTCTMDAGGLVSVTDREVGVGVEGGVAAGVGVAGGVTAGVGVGAGELT